MSQQHGLQIAIAPELDLDDDGRIRRTGNLRTGAVHIIALEIGIGVLALAWSVAQLGWVGGPVVMACFAFVMYFSAFMMIHCYRSPDCSEKKQRNSTFMDAVSTHLRLCFRMAYVASTTALAILFPYFNEVLGVLGAVAFWPLAIYLPVEMYCVQRGIRPWTRKWLALQAYSAVCFVVGTFALVGSVVGIVVKRLG
ncbi:hypothetical protein ACP70R_010487 [Stipagrostis hirtigluma subsp. patula]